MKPDYKLVAKAKYIHATADLASELWHEVYKRYYPAKQLDTLVEELQSADAIEEDIDNDVNYFLVVLGGKTIGYFAWKMENTALHLMHLYLRPEYRGKALGRDIVLSCERLARGEGKGRVWCTVHAKALPVQQFFKALRYRNLKPAEQENGTVPRDEVVFEHTLGCLPVGGIRKKGEQHGKRSSYRPVRSVSGIFAAQDSGTVLPFFTGCVQLFRAERNGAALQHCRNAGGQAHLHRDHG